MMLSKLRVNNTNSLEIQVTAGQLSGIALRNGLLREMLLFTPRGAGEIVKMVKVSQHFLNKPLKRLCKVARLTARR
jgi:hypothetical protein